MSRIDDLYITKKQNEGKITPEYDKSQYYIGRISKVDFNGGTIQTENMTVLRQRLNHKDILTPNAVGYLVVIDGAEGIFLGQIVESYLNNSDSIHDAMKNKEENILHPNLKVKLIGVYDENNFNLAGEQSFGIGDKVYIANSRIIKKYVESIQIHDSSRQNSKQDIDNDLKFAKLNSQINNNIDFQISADNLLDHHLIVIGATNSGKSTSSLAILDKLHEKCGKFLIIDPTGEYCDSFSNEVDVDVKTLGKDLFFDTSSLTDEQWINIFHPNQNSQEIALINAIKKLKYKKFVNEHNEYIKSLEENANSNLRGAVKSYIAPKSNWLDCRGCTMDELKAMEGEWQKEEYKNYPFDLKYLPNQIMVDSSKFIQNATTDYKLKFMFDTFTYGINKWLIEKISHYITEYKLLDLFKSNSKDDISNALDKFINGCKSLYIGLKNNKFPSDIGQIVIDYIGKYLLENNNRDNPITLFIDEAHRYAKETDEDGNYVSSLITIAREGRKNGIFLFLTTQSPKDVPTIVLNQMGTLLIHRLTGQNEIAAISNFLDNNSIIKLSNLNQGEAILTGVNLLQPVDLKINQVKTRVQHNQTPHLINEKKAEKIKLLRDLIHKEFKEINEILNWKYGFETLLDLYEDKNWNNSWTIARDKDIFITLDDYIINLMTKQVTENKKDGIFIFNMNLNSGTSNLDRIIDNIDEVFSKVIPSSINTNDRKIQNFSVAVLGSICLAEKGKIHFLDINAVRII